MDATAIVHELEHQGIISNGDQLTISLNKDATQQNQLLHTCMKKKCNAKALTDVCDIITMVKGNPRMKSFGEDMKMEWEKGVCCHCVHACACDECVNVYVYVCVHAEMHVVLGKLRWLLLNVLKVLIIS